MKTKLITLCVLALCSGCGRADVSDARLNYLLARDHAWLDVRVQAVPRPVDQSACSLVLSVNGERMLSELAHFAEATKQGVPLGYRLVVPAG